MRPEANTCWTLIHGAAHGNSEDRQGFAHRYLPVVRAYLAARWSVSPLLTDVDDAVQEVFVECFSLGGVLERADQDRPGGFRAFLFAVVRNIARRVEQRRAKLREHAPGTGIDLSNAPSEANDDDAGKAFDRAWAQSIMDQAADFQSERARELGEEAVRRVELLRLRFQDNKPIREIATMWDTDAERLHYEYSKARSEFEAALREVVAFHHPNSPHQVRGECERLIGLLE